MSINNYNKIIKLKRENIELRLFIKSRGLTNEFNKWKKQYKKEDDKNGKDVK